MLPKTAKIFHYAGLIFVTLDDRYRVKDAHAIFWRKYAPITTYDKLKNSLLDNVNALL